MEHNKVFSQTVPMTMTWPLRLAMAIHWDLLGLTRTHWDSLGPVRAQWGSLALGFTCVCVCVLLCGGEGQFWRENYFTC